MIFYIPRILTSRTVKRNVGLFASLVFTSFFLSAPVFAEKAGNWYVRPYVGLSQMSDLRVSAANVDGVSGVGQIALDSGFTSGFSVGYHRTERFALELAWEYRTNESMVNLAGLSSFDEGNTASSVFFLNSIVSFSGSSLLQPYVGVGIAWAQEVDVDLERAGEENSYSGDGDFGYQIIAGLNYSLGDAWVLSPELRYGRISGIMISGEGVAGSINKLDYQPFTLQLGLAYSF